MNKFEAFRLAIAEIGGGSAAWLASFIKRRFNITIEPKYIPIFRASLEDLGRKPAPRQIEVKSAELVLDPVPKVRSGRRFKHLDSAEHLAPVRELALQLIAKHGLHDWSFAFNRRKQTMGLCLHHSRRIELSVHFVERNDQAEILDTILHEIAHALAGHRAGHGAVWKRKCLEIGARPVRCSVADMPEGRWQACCRGCGTKFDRHRKPRRSRGWFCRTCGPMKGKLAWRDLAAE